MMMNDESRALAGTRLGVVGKGGAGKSTVVVLLARALRRRGYDVYVVDADSTNVGLHRALGIEQPPVPLLEHFGGMVFSGGRVTCPVDDPTPLVGGEVSIDELPDGCAALNDDGIHLLAAGKIGGMGPGAGCDGPVAKIARDFRIRGAGDRAVTLLDYKAGFEDAARGGVTSLDWVIDVVDPTSAAIEMAVNMKDMVDQIRAGRPPATAHLESPELVELAQDMYRGARIKGVLAILNRVTGPDVERSLRARLAERGEEPVGVLHEDPSIPIAWLQGEPLDDTRTRHDADGIVRVLEAAERGCVKRLVKA